MKTKAILCLILLAWPVLTVVSAKSVRSVPHQVKVTRNISRTTSAENNFNLADFGAVGDGVTDCGPALQNALNAIAEAGGGTLFVPAGRYAIITPVEKDFTGLASSLTILGVESSTPVPPPTASGQELSHGLDLASEFAPKTGELEIAIKLTGLQDFTIKDITFIGTPDVFTDALITLALNDVQQATVRHCEFYGLSSLSSGGAIILSTRSGLDIEQSVFLGNTCNSGVSTSVVQNIEWKNVTVADAIFIDYGQRTELFGKLGYGGPASWVNIGNAAAIDNDSPRREVVIRNVFFDEGGFNALSSLPYLYLPPTAPIDLLYVTRAYVNVSSLGSSGNYFYGAKDVLVEKSHYGLSQNADSAISLLSIDNAILDQLDCVDGANRIRADEATGKLAVINSVYTFLDSDSPQTRVITTETTEDDPVQYVRQQFSAILGHEPDAAAHFYWSDQILQCEEDAACLNARRAALADYLATSPQEKFAVSGQIVGENGAGMPGVKVVLAGSQNVTTETDVDGRYQFSNLPTSGAYTVVPSLNHYTLTPASYEIVTPATDQVFDAAASLNHHAIAGTVSDGTGTPLEDVIVTLSGSRSMKAKTAADGQYKFEDLPAGGNYTITSHKTTYVFSPPDQTFNDLDADQTQNFAGSFVLYTIGGILVDGNNNPIGGIKVTLSGSQQRTTTSNSEGEFFFTDTPAEGNYTITPTLIGYSFSPSSRTYTSLAANQYHAYVGTYITYSISGRVADSGGIPLSGATIKLSGQTSATTTSDSNGNYGFSALPQGGSYTLTARKTSYSFTPASQTFNQLDSNKNAQFTSTFISHSIGGIFIDANNNPIGGVKVTLSGSQQRTTTSNSKGEFFFTDTPAEGNYTVTPALIGYSFSPSSKTYNSLAANQYHAYVGTFTTHSISGRITQSGGIALSSATVSLSGQTSATTTSDSSGNYSFSTLPTGGSYTLTVSKIHYTFSQPGRTFNNLVLNQTADFAATQNVHSISGRVTAGQSNLSGVVVTVSGSQSGSATTDVNGNYTFDLFAGGSYTIRPAKTNYIFSPAGMTFSDLGANQPADFVATLQSVLEFSAASYSAAEDASIISVTVTRSGDTSVESEVVYSGLDGTADQRSDVIPIIGRLTFAPGETSKDFSVLITDDAHVEGNETITLELSDLVGCVLGNNSTATLTIIDNDNDTTPANPIDDAQFFVRQHYRDFLNRQADANGLAFWSDQITSCGTDAACIADRRVNVSAAFFLSIEFQQTGFLIYRLYQVSFAQPPQHLDEFLLDTRTIGAGVVVNAPGWQELLEANKKSFIEDFVARAEFKQAYALTLTPAEFVAQLNSKTGGALSANEVVAAIAEFGGAPTSDSTQARARALRRVAENETFSQRQLSSAFVSMQYFGYLQRNPNESPDANLDGYNFWLHKLDEFGGDFRRAEMVKSFLISSEFRARFGTP